MTQDIFDQIIAGDIPSYKVYEDEDVLAILDIGQLTPGHTLVIPKADVANIYDYTDDIAQRVLTKLPKLARAIKASDDTIVGINIFSNNEAGAGQTVFHSHWHLVPRYENDNVNIPHGDHSADYTADDYQTLADSITSQLEDYYV